MDYKIKIGFERNEYGTFPIAVDLKKHCHWLVVGPTGSGKSVFLSYILTQILNLNDLKLYIADFKGSKDFAGITPDYAEYEDVTGLFNQFYDTFCESKRSKNGKKIIMVIDEYNSWIGSLDKKQSADIKQKVAQVLQQGRSLPDGGAAWLICAMQRCDADNFTGGARDNFMVRIGLSNLSKESKMMLGFSADDIPSDYYKPQTGRGLIQTEGNNLKVFDVPKIEAERIQKLLQIKGNRKC